MIINHQSVYGSDKKEIVNLQEKLLPYLKKDPDIIPPLYECAEILLRAPDIATYYFTKESRNMISQIKISNTEKTVELLNSRFGEVEVGNFLFGSSFMRFAVIDGILYCLVVYLNNLEQEQVLDVALNGFKHSSNDNPFYNAQDYLTPKKTSYISYSCFFINLANPEKNNQSELIQTKSIQHALQVFAFFKAAEVETLFVQSGKKVGTKKSGYTNVTQNDITIINSLWNKIIIRDEEFGVRGHFRLQPHGEGRKQIKLKWIEPFKKEGYRRLGGGVPENITN